MRTELKKKRRDVTGSESLRAELNRQEQNRTQIERI